jgi:hypothetical protein
MAKISFLELTAARPHSSVTIETEDGKAEFEITGVSLAELADISKKFPSFLRVIEGDGGMFSASEALPALIAAGLGHHNDSDYERHAARLPASVVLGLAGEIVKLTFRPSIALAESEPAPEEAEDDQQADDERRPGVISPLRLSS